MFLSDSAVRWWCEHTDNNYFAVKRFIINNGYALKINRRYLNRRNMGAGSNIMTGAGHVYELDFARLKHEFPDDLEETEQVTD